MRALILCALLASLGACERRNPLYCDEGAPDCGRRRRCDFATHSCVEVSGGDDCEPGQHADDCPPDLPLCDAAAAVCRPCEPGEDHVCAERDGRTPRCLAGRCVECASPGEGSREAGECVARRAATPVCDRQTNTCRACRLHAECASGVCAKDPLSDALGVPQGNCVPADQVMVVDPSLCHEAGPVFCTPKQAIDRLDRNRRYVVIRKSAREQDFSDLEIGRFENQGLELYLIGPLADGSPVEAAAWPRVEIGASGRRGFIVGRKSHVTLEGFLIRRADVGVQCYGDGPGTDTQVRVVRSLLGDNRVALSVHDECVLQVEQSWIGRGPQKGAFARVGGNELAIDVTRADFAVRNTVFADNGDVRRDLFGGIRVTAGLGGGRDGKRLSSVINSTFYGQNAWITVGDARYMGVVCDAPLGSRLVIMNTLFFQDPQAPIYERYVTPNCGGELWHLGSDDPSLTPNGSVVLPRGELPGFRDAAARDLHIGRPAGVSSRWQQVQSGGVRSVRVGTQEVHAPDVDLDGVPRQQDGRVSMGAYEVEP